MRLLKSSLFDIFELHLGILPLFDAFVQLTNTNSRSNDPIAIANAAANAKSD
jgi:hypothetical protein